MGKKVLCSEEEIKLPGLGKSPINKKRRAKLTGTGVKEKGQVRLQVRRILEKDAGFGSLGKNVYKWKSQVCRMRSRPEDV